MDQEKIFAHHMRMDTFPKHTKSSYNLTTEKQSDQKLGQSSKWTLLQRRLTVYQKAESLITREL